MAAPHRTRVIAIVGADGTGKTSVATELARLATAEGMRVIRVHHRPGIVARRAQGQDTTRPHAQPARSSVTAALKLAVVWLDWQLARARAAARERRPTVVLVERGWWDMSVDPVRYRLPGGTRRLVRALGATLPPADVMVLLSGPPAAIHARKPEIPAAEIARQSSEWAALAPRVATSWLVADTVRDDVDEVTRRVWSMARAAPGCDERVWRRAPLTRGPVNVRWTGVPSDCQVSFPRAYGRVARVALPVRRATASLWSGRRADPPFDLDALGALLGLAVDGAVAIDSSFPGRTVVALVRQDRISHIVKIGAPHDAGLANEAALLTRLQNRHGALVVPRVHWIGCWDDRLVVATEAVNGSWAPILDPYVAARLCTQLVGGVDGSAPVVHGDFAPWNIVGAPERPALVDWEFGRQERAPLIDLAHYVVACGSRLHTWRPATAVELLCGPGGPGWLHLSESGEDPSSAPARLAELFAAGTDIRAGRERAFWQRMMSAPGPLDGHR
jgi:hypothetical protein